MQREKDYLKKKIDQLATALGKLIAQAFQTEPILEEQQIAEAFDQILQQEKGLSLEELQNFSHDTLVDILKNQYAITPTQMQLIADLLYYLADRKTFEEQYKRTILYQKVILLYEQVIVDGVALPLDKFIWLDTLKKQIKEQ